MSAYILMAHRRGLSEAYLRESSGCSVGWSKYRTCLTMIILITECYHGNTLTGMLPVLQTYDKQPICAVVRQLDNVIQYGMACIIDHDNDKVESCSCYYHLSMLFPPFFLLW